MNANSVINHCQTAFSAYYFLKMPQHRYCEESIAIKCHRIQGEKKIHCLFIDCNTVR